MNESTIAVQAELSSLDFNEIGQVSYLATHYSGDNEYRRYSEADIGITLAVLLRSEDEKLIAARVDGKIIGGIIGFLERHPFNRSLLLCKVRTIIVHEDYRKTGIGRQLIEALEEWARGRKAKALIMSYHHDSLRSSVEPFLLSLGYEPFKYEVKKEL